MAENNKISNLQSHLRQKKVIDVSTTKNCFAVLCDDGELLIQGATQLGENEVPVLKNGEKFVNILGGTNHFVALSDKNIAYAWGHNDGKQTEVHGESAAKIFVGSKQTYLANENNELTYSTGFRAPQAYDEDLHVGAVGGEVSLIQLSDSLRPEMSHSVSASVDWARKFGSWETNVTLEGFFTQLNDVFSLVENGHDDLGNLLLLRTNEKGARVMGLNVEGKIAYTPWVEASAGVTLQRSKYNEAEYWSDDDTVEPTTNMFRSPNVYGYFTVTTQPIKNFKIDLSGNYMGRMYVEHYAGGMLPDGSTLEKDRIEHTKAFFDMGLKLSYDFKVWKTIGLQVNAGVRNILNSYQNDFDRGENRDSGYIYGPSLPRSVFVGAKLSF